VVTVVLAMVLIERTDARPLPASPETSNPKNVMRLARIIHPVSRRRSSAAAGIFRPRVLLRRKPEESIMMPRLTPHDEHPACRTAEWVPVSSHTARRSHSLIAVSSLAVRITTMVT
jgi:hypothetical protein